jgi:putative transcriptional regulator
MIKCHLSSLLGEKKIRVAELSRDTGINKNTLHRLYNETATRVDLEVLEKLCLYLDVKIEDLLEVTS